ncbi:MAG: PLP-dependent aminotransferase family protein [Caulobacteraceae bacterium]
MSWAELYPWSAPRRDAPAMRQVYEQARQAILAGALAPGARLPSTRDLASRVGVARATVVSAYELLLAEGYAEARTGAGTFVAGDLSGLEGALAPPRAAVAPPPVLPDALRRLDAAPPILNLPGEALFNTGRTRMDKRALQGWRRAARRVAESLGPAHFGYAAPAGDPELREAIAQYLRAARGVVCEPSQVIVTAGAQQAIDIAARALISEGTEVWIEDPAYGASVRALKALGAKLVPTPVDGAGLVVSEGVKAAPGARVAYVTPSHQYPLGVTLSMARRLELLAWARSAGAWLIEDDYASEFRYAGPPLASLQGLDGGQRTLYVGTFNKALFPGLRLGYLVAPEALAPRLVAIREVIDRQPASLTQAVVLEFMRSGDFAAHIRRRRLAYGAQRDALVDALRAHCGAWLDPEVPEQGMHLVAPLKAGLRDLEAQEAAARAGVIAKAVSPLYHRAAPRAALVFGFAGFAPETMAPAARRLATALGELTPA